MYGNEDTKGVMRPANYYKPVLARSLNTDYKNGVNILNSYMDHNCDSFYNSQQRISRFPGLVYAPGDQSMKYWVQQTGSLPKKMRWRLDTKNPKHGITVMLRYEGA